MTVGGAANGRIMGGASRPHRTARANSDDGVDGRGRIRRIRSAGSGGPDAGTGVCRWGGVLLLGLSTVLAWERAPVCQPMASRVTPAEPSRAIAATFALARRTRSDGASSTWRPRRPAETNTDLEVERRRVDDDRERPPRAERADPADDVAGRPFRLGGIGHDRSTTAERIGKALEVELAVDRDDGQDEPSIDGRGERLVHPPGVDAEGRRGVRAVRGASVAVAPVAFRRLVGVDAVGDPGPGDQVERARSRTRPRPDATRFRLCSGRLRRRPRPSTRGVEPPSRSGSVPAAGTRFRSDA